MPRGYPDTITCPGCGCGQMAEWSYCPDCGSDLHHKEPKKKDKITLKDCGTQFIAEVCGDFISVTLHDPEWGDMTCELPKNKFITAINRLG